MSKSYAGNFKDEKCQDCYGWDGGECSYKFSPYFRKEVPPLHKCHMIQTEEENTDVHPRVHRTNIWDTGMRYRD